MSPSSRILFPCPSSLCALSLGEFLSLKLERQHVNAFSVLLQGRHSLATRNSPKLFEEVLFEIWIPEVVRLAVHSVSPRQA